MDLTASQKLPSPSELSQRLKMIAKVGAPLKKWKKIADKSKDRYNRLKELVTTEADYHSDLVTIKERIKQELEAAGLISSLQANQMFPNLDGMISLSEQIHAELREILLTWDRNKSILSTPMIKYSRFLMIYSDYFKNLLDTQKKLKSLLSKNEEARQI